MILSGNEAVVHGALKAGAKYFAGYPITPSSEIMHEWVQQLRKKNDDFVFLQTEDEISAIHSIIGGALAGKKSFTTTSGPGFSLMQEGIGLAFAYKLPMVIVNVQRQGPSTGMPTLFSQGDILQTQYGTHGDHQAITFYPNSVQECYDLTVQAFNAACASKSPIIVLSDAFLGHMYENVNLDYKDEILDYNFEPVGTGTRHFTGLTQKKGMPDTDNPETCKEWLNELLEPIDKISKNYELYEYEENLNSDTLIISFGTLSRVVAQWKNEFALFRPIRLFPVLDEVLKNITAKYKKIIIVEANKGQYKFVLEACLKRDINVVSNIGGKIDVQELYSQIKKISND